MESMYERLIILKYKHSHRAIEKENVIQMILIIFFFFLTFFVL